MPAFAGHRTASWTAPTANEDGTPLTDLAGYRLYRCATSPCTRAVGTLIGTVAAPATTFSIPHSSQGFLTVTAFDTSGNESAESNSVPFDVLAPGPASGLTVQ
jgi:hypothetical protein